MILSSLLVFIYRNKELNLYLRPLPLLLPPPLLEVSFYSAVIELDWRLFGLAVELQLDLDLDPLILTPVRRGLKLMEFPARHSLYFIGREVGRYMVGAQ